MWAANARWLRAVSERTRHFVLGDEAAASKTETSFSIYLPISGRTGATIDVGHAVLVGDTRASPVNIPWYVHRFYASLQYTCCY